MAAGSKGLTLKAQLEQKEARLAEVTARLNEAVADRQWAVEMIRRQDEYLAALHDTTLGLISRRDLDDLLQALVARACQLLGTPQGFIYLVTPEGNELERKVGVGVFDINRVPRLKLGEGLSGIVWQTGRAVVTNDYAHWPGRPPSISPHLIQAMAGVPLISGSKVVGVLAVAFEGGSERTFGDEEVVLLSRFAELASIALDNARLFEEGEAQRRDLERLYASVQQKKQYLEALVENSPVAITTTDLDHRVVSWNPEAERLFGYALEEAIGHNLYELIAAKGLQAEVLSHAQQLQDAQRIHTVTQCRRKDGTLVDAEFLALPVTVAGEGLSFIAIFHDITELLRARKEAEAANLTKSQFLANMSHELRTPLNAIIGYSEILQEEAQDLGHEGYLPDLQKIHAAGKRLLRLVSDVLDFSTIEAGKMVLHLETFDIREMVREVISATKPLVAEHGNTLELQIAPDVATMHADLAKVRKSLFNLLSNACKFTERGLISLQIAHEHDVVTFKISDTGIGMSQEQLDKLFQTFNQMDASAKRKYGGTGLGLTLSRRLCRMMGGNITVQSSLGEGSTFTMSLPDYVVLAGTESDSVASDKNDAVDHFRSQAVSRRKGSLVPERRSGEKTAEGEI